MWHTNWYVRMYVCMYVGMTWPRTGGNVSFLIVFVRDYIAKL